MRSVTRCWIGGAADRTPAAVLVPRFGSTFLLVGLFAAGPATAADGPSQLITRTSAVAPAKAAGGPAAAAAPSAGLRPPSASVNAPAAAPNQASRPPGRPLPSVALKIVPEFQVQHVLGHDQTGSLIAMAFNEFGQIIAARESGPLLLIDDSDGDQVPDRVRVYCDLVKNCQGILPLNGDVYAVGEGPAGTGLYRLRDLDRDRKLEDVRPLVRFEVKAAEHGPHGLVLGPDGMIYVMVGNHAQMKAPADASSPYRHSYEGDLPQPRYEDPGGHALGIRAPGGTIIRTDVEGKRVEVFAGGLRNPYDMAFHRDGELFTHDADMEADEGTSWYRPTRIHHVVAGAEFGWRSGWAKWPEYYLDSLPAIAHTGRSSPTGMVIYQHHMFPARYHDAMFSCDWAQGRIFAVRLRAEGSGYTADSHVFLEGQPLSVTDIDVGPDGGLYFTTGGRGTAGNLYRAVWLGSVPPEVRQLGSGIEAALRQPQLDSAWGRQQVAAVRQRLGQDWTPELVRAARERARSDQQRAQAVNLMQLLGPPADSQLLLELSRDPQASIRALAAYHMGLVVDPRLAERLRALIQDNDPLVRRRACEALARTGQTLPLEELQPLLTSDDRFLAWAARRLLEQSPPESWRHAVLETGDQRLFVEGATALLVVAPDRIMAQQVIDRTLHFMSGYVNDRDFVDMLRVQQLALHRGQLAPENQSRLRDELAEEYPAGHPAINRELVRLLTYLQASALIDRFLEQLETDLPDMEKLHLAGHLGFLRDGWTTEQKLRMLAYLERPLGGGRGRTAYAQNFARQFASTLTPEQFESVLARADELPGAALAALYQLPKDPNAERITQLIELDRRLDLNTSITIRRLKIGIAAVLARSGDSAALAHLREAYDAEPERRVEIALGLLEHPGGENWPYLVRSLPILEGAAARDVLRKLKSIDRVADDPEALRQVILLGLKLKDEGGDDAVGLLEKWAGFSPSEGDVAWDSALAAWQKWFVEKYPDAPEPQLAPTASRWDLAGLMQLLNDPEGQPGSAERGGAVFEKAQCAKCHRLGDLGESLGPDLSGITGRFMRKEIIEAILQPSLVVSEQYRAQQVQTRSGRTFTGIVVHQDARVLVLLQEDGNKVHLPQNEVDVATTSKVSIMPSGLLDPLTLEEIRDLLAFLTSDPEPRLTDAAPAPPRR